ncbi:MAG: hypothetical protein LBQ60_01015 [Bacteroidales bacterium]|nr:hypothetical protein [Bacteroidales bacterium]
MLKLLFLQTNQPVKSSVAPHKSNVYFIPDPKRLGIDSMGELATTFELSNQFLDENGNPASFIHIAEALEFAFNFTFGNAYKSKARIFNRKPFNLTKSLDHLKNLLIRESRNRDKNKMKKDEFSIR